MSAPKRIQLRRTKGWRKPEGTIVVARPSRWGNPFEIGAGASVNGFVRGGAPYRFHASLTADLAVALYRYALTHDTGTGLSVWWRIHGHELAGHDLACWCPLDQPCHADVLLELANA